MITKEELKHLETLARLNPSNEMQDKLAKWLSETLDYIEVLESLDTSKVAPTSRVTNLINVFRKDEQVEDKDFKLAGTHIKTSKVLKKDPPASNLSVQTGVGGSLINHE